MARQKRPPTAKQLQSRWKKGQSGNPKGRARVHESVAEVIRLKAAEPSDESGKSRLEKSIDKAWGMAERGDHRALEILLDRGWGRPPVIVRTWRDEYIEALKAGQVKPKDVEREIGVDLAAELFRAAGIEVA